MARSKRARQTRLSFNPLPTSSPAGARAVEEHGLRSYANVEYEGSPRHKKRRRLDVDEVEGIAIQLGHPTPEKSSQHQQNRLSDLQVQEESEDPIAPTSTARRRRRAKQGKLDFSNHIGLSLHGTDDRVKLREKDNQDSDDSEDESDDKMRAKPTPRQTRSLEGGIFGSQPHPTQHYDDEDSEDDFPVRKKGSSPLKRLRAGKRSTSSNRITRRSQRLEALDSEYDDDEEVATSTAPRRSSNIDLTGGESETSGDDAPALHSSPARKRRAIAKSYPKDDFVVLSSDDSSSAPSVVITSAIPKRPRRTKPTRDSTSEDEEDEDDEPVRAKNGRRPAHKLTSRQQEDLNEDLEFLQSSPPPAQSKAQLKKPNPRQEALEALKRKRAGLGAAVSSSQTQKDGSRHDPATIDTSDEEEAQAQEEEYEEEAATARRQVLFGAKNEEDEDFIVEDDENDAIGAPHVEMPLWAGEFSRMKVKDLFKFAIQWLVQKKLNPGYANANDEEFELAFRKLDDEVRGLSVSKYISAAWTRDFTVSLQGRPGVEYMEISGLRGETGLDKCDACNRSGHPATWSIQFLGKPYNVRTLEDVEQYSDSDSDSEAEAEEIDSKGRVVPPESRVYNIGRFCKENATTAHALEHWKLQLYHWVIQHLEEQGHLRPEKIVKRDGLKEKKRRKYADKVVDEMLEMGQVRKLYKDFRDVIDHARDKQTGWRSRTKPTF